MDNLPEMVSSLPQPMCQPETAHVLPMRPDFSDKPSTTASSWLDLYPPTPVSSTPSPSNPKAKRIIRVEKLKATLDDIKVSTEIRENFLHIYSTETQSCPTCTRQKREPGSCDRTCPLLRPGDQKDALPNIPPAWAARAAAANLKYHRLRWDVSHVKYENINESKLAKWEREVEELRKGTLNMSEKREERKWPEKPADPWHKVEGAKADWSWGEAWGKGYEDDESVGPEEMGSVANA